MMLFGQVEYTDEVPSKLKELIQSRYQAQLDELNSLSFRMLFFLGQTFPILHLFLIFPAVILAAMLLNREAITLYRGARLLVGHAVLTSEDRTTYAQILRLGVLFATSFEDGEVLISCNYGDKNFESRKLTRRAYPGRSIADTWVKHQQFVQAKELHGNRANRNLSFEKFVNMVG